MARAIFIVVIAPALGVLLWMASASRVQRGDFVVASDVVRTIDPQRVSWLQEIQIVGALFEGLTRLNPISEQPEPASAVRWEISPDGLNYRFELRPGVCWSNGDPLVAEHFRCAWLRALQPATQSQYASLLFVIDGAEAYYRSRTDRDASNDARADSVGVVADGERVLHVRLRAPCPYFLDLTAFPAFFPNHPQTLERFGYRPEIASSPSYLWTRPGNLIGNGAFTLEGWDFKRRMLLRRNSHYWEAKIDAGATEYAPESKTPDTIEVFFTSDPTVALLAYETGRVDLVTKIEPDISRELQAEQSAGRREDLHAGDRFATYFYRVNCTRPPFDRPELRRALSLAVDKTKLCRFVLGRGETPADTFVPPMAIPLMPRKSANGTTVLYQPPAGLGAGLTMDERRERAREALRASGYDPARDRPIEIVVPSEAQISRIAEALQATWLEALGVRVELKKLERKVVSERIRNLDYDIAPSDWYGDYMDPIAFLELFVSGSGQNRTGWSSAEYDRLIAAAAVEPDNAVRYNTLAEAERILVEDQLPIIPLFFKRGAYLLRRDFVGVADNARDLLPIQRVRRLTEAPVISR